MLTDEQCAEIAAWAQREFPPPRVVVEREMCAPGEPRKVPGPLVASLHVHPEDYWALRDWADRQAR
jgi:hypothetical protein